MDINLNYFILLFLSFILSFVFSYFIVAKFIKIILKTNFLGKDINKINKPKVCELGGVPVFLSFLLSLLFVILINYIFIIIFNIGYNLISITKFSLILLTLFLMFFMGFIDDILGWKKGITHQQHFILPIIFSIPMILYVLIYDISTILIPFLGILQVGFWYAFLFVPVAITATSNAFNLFAGFNGLEAGMSIIIFLTIAILALLQKQLTLLIIIFAWIGSLLAFLKYNKYPSKIFPGDIVTLVSGAFIGLCAIVLQLEFLLAFLIIIYIIEFVIKFKHKFKTECFGIITKSGYLKPNPKGGSLTHFILKQRKFTEKSFVFTIYSIQGIISLITIFLYFLI